jgi:hypothetical protein
MRNRIGNYQRATGIEPVSSVWKTDIITDILSPRIVEQGDYISKRCSLKLSNPSNTHIILHRLESL